MSAAHDKVYADLLYMSGIGLILPYPSNIMYTNQAGGVLCTHPVIEGVFIPLNDMSNDRGTAPQNNAAELTDHFCGPKYGGHGYHGIDQETADFIDGFLAKSDITDFINVDRDRLKECMESWIHVKVDNTKKHLLFRNIQVNSGILTWPNSD